MVAILEQRPYDLSAVYAMDIGQASAPCAQRVHEHSSGDVTA